MDITKEDAELQGKILREAGMGSPVPQVGAVLRSRAREWSSAAQDLELATTAGHTARIVLVGTCEAGMMVVDKEVGEVIRVIHQGNNVSLQLRDDRGIVSYMNFISQQSPVVAIC